MNTHHRLYPKYAYVTPLERAYRELPENKEVICTYLHNMIHLEEPTPDKPSREVMINAVYRSEE